MKVKKVIFFSIVMASFFLLIYFSGDNDVSLNVGQEDNRPPEEEKEKGDTTRYSPRFKSGVQVSFETANPDSKGSWKCIGPFGIPEVRFTASGTGAADHVTIHPDNPSIMYLSVRNGGLFRTTNHGKHWEPLSDYFCSGCYCTALCRSQPDILYMGSEDNSIWVTDDACQTWTLRKNGITDKVYDIQIDPDNPDRALAATLGGLMLTVDRGINWTKVISGRITDIHVTDNWEHIAVTKNQTPDQVKPGYLYSSTQGDEWQEIIITDKFEEISKAYIAFHEPRQGGELIVYAFLMSDQGASKVGPTRFIGLFKSVDTGQTFTEIVNSRYNYPNGPVLLQNKNGGFVELGDDYGGVNPYTSATWVSEFYVDPNNPNHLLTMREKFWTSFDGGQTWQMGPSYGSSNWADNRYCIHNYSKDYLYWCNDGGLWGMAFKDLFPNYLGAGTVREHIGDLCIQEGSQCDVSLMNKRVFMTGGQDLGQFFTRKGRDTHVGAADVYRGRICPVNDSLFLTGGLEIKISGYSEDFTLYNNINANHFDGYQIFGFTRNSDKLVRSPKGQNAWLTSKNKNENKFSWTGSGNSLIDEWEEVVHPGAIGVTRLSPGTFEQSRANEDVAFLGSQTSRKVFITNDLTSLHPEFSELPDAPSATHYRIATHPDSVNTVVLATEKKVYLSKDKGETWTRLPSFPKYRPFKILIDKNTEYGVYAVTSTTVYYLDETLSGWIEFNKGLPNRHITEMRMVHYPDGDSRLILSKYGRGVWESPLYSVQNSQLPFPDFELHGASKSEITLGESVQMTDLSGNADEISWEMTHESGQYTIRAGNEIEPVFSPVYTGFYSVSQIAENSNGTKTLIKDLYVKLNNGWTLNTDDISSTENLVTVYPNPSNGEFNIQYQSSEDGEVIINILNFSGQLIDSKVHSSSIPEMRIPIFMEKEPKGIYFVQVIQGNFSETHKILLQ